MGRTRKLSYALWSTVAGVGLAACGSDDKVGHLPDAPPLVDAPPVAIAGVPAQVTAVSECGVATPPTVDVVVTNLGTAELVISGADANGGFVVTTTLPLTIAAGAQATLAVRPPAAVIGTDRGGSTKTGTLTLSTNAPDLISPTVALIANVVGANVAFTNAAGAPITLAFSGSSGACPAPQAVFIRNTGSAPMTFGAASASGFAFTGFSGGMIEAGGSVTQMVRPFATGSCSYAGAITYQVTGSVCSAPLATLQATFNITGTSSCFCS